MRRGTIIYDDRYGHVCTCTQRVAGSTTRYHVYTRSVDVVRDVEPTQTGSWLYACKRCGATAWSGL